MDRKTLEDLGIPKADIDIMLNALHRTPDSVEGIEAELEKQKELNKQLQADLKAKDDDIKNISEKSKTYEETQAALTELKQKYESQSLEHQNQLDNIEFNSILDKTISSFKGRNSKAIMALLDIDNLKNSKNRTEDIKSSVQNLINSEDSSFLFGEPEAKAVSSANIIGSTSTQAPEKKYEIPLFF